ARAAVDRRDIDAAAHEIRAALRINPNDPVALAMLAAVERARGRLREAQAAAALASVVRPYDASLVYNLALICRERGEHATLADCVARLAQMDGQDSRAPALRAQLEGT
ncbi:MAG TPA: hypothetical protein VIL19_03210, partial [Casimicrobiaceae bacterium]